MKTTFIYALNCPITGATRYIGKAGNPKHRLSCHLHARENCHRTNWIRSLGGRSPILEVLDEVPENEWMFWEVEYIRLYRALGFKLVNGTSGGDGTFNPSKETRQKMSIWQLGEKNNMFGKTFSPEERTKWKLANRNRKTSRNVSGFVGVGWHKFGKKWRATITVDKKQIALGSFLKIEDAIFARALGVDKHFSK